MQTIQQSQRHPNKTNQINSFSARHFFFTFFHFIYAIMQARANKKIHFIDSKHTHKTKTHCHKDTEFPARQKLIKYDWEKMTSSSAPFHRFAVLSRWKWRSRFFWFSLDKKIGSESSKKQNAKMCKRMFLRITAMRRSRLARNDEKTKI